MKSSVRLIGVQIWTRLTRSRQNVLSIFMRLLQLLFHLYKSPVSTYVGRKKDRINYTIIYSYVIMMMMMTTFRNDDCYNNYVHIYTRAMELRD
jgi:hypothetical protein